MAGINWQADALPNVSFLDHVPLMRRFCVIKSCILMMVTVFFALPAGCKTSQEESTGKSSPVQSVGLYGVVRDSDHRPVAGALVCLTSVSQKVYATQTDVAGNYRFESLPPGSYSLIAEMDGKERAAAGPFILRAEESLAFDLALDSRKEKDTHNSSAENFNFSDEVHFTVAGVADTTNFGGHGSSVAAIANKEAVAEAVAGLSGTPIGGSAANSPGFADSENSLRDAASSNPTSFEATYRLGKWFVDHGKPQEGIQYLKQANLLRPNDYNDGYELALAYAKSGDYKSARLDLNLLLAISNQPPEESAELHHLLGDIEEASANPLQAVHEYEEAANLNPTEPNLFSWGAELLLHHAAAPAIEVFSKGTRLFPRSVRMLAGLGAAWYALGSYDPAMKRLCQASALDPTDPDPYLLIGKIQDVQAEESPCVTDALGRFAKLEPANAQANYYFAVALVKQQKLSIDAQDLSRVQSLLEKAIHLDPKLADAHLELGIVYSRQKDLPRAISAYREAIATEPSLEQAHYRLALAYRESGEVAKARSELQLYQQISKEKEKGIERQHHEVQQFIYQLRGGTADAK
ncbi:MAG: tetratricopeptide repeat protein [Candidatus Sulfotelmatobacter sp.]